ncbi:MAG: cation transporter [Gammaproteobacteria bacterium]
MKSRLLLFHLWFSLSGMALAASSTVTLDVQNMTCPVCPITIKKALEQVAGVQRVTIEYASKSVTVQFDNTIATTDKLIKAITDAGYPSVIKGSGK